MPYKEFEPRDTLEEALSKLWGAAQEFIPTTRLEEIICMIANAQPTGIHAVPDIEESDIGKVLTVDTGEAVWKTQENPIYKVNLSIEDGSLDKTWQEINDAMGSGKFVILYSYSNEEGNIASQSGFISSIEYSALDGYSLYAFIGDQTVEYSATTANDYPSPVE